MSSPVAAAPARPSFPMDHVLLSTVMFLLATGVAMVYSASFAVAETEFGNDTYFLVRHITWVTVGFVAMLVIARIDYHRWQPVALPIYLVSLVLLVAVFIPGLSKESYGAARWIVLTPTLSFQPSEVAKLAMILYLSAWMTRVGRDINKLTFGTIPFVIIVAGAAGLILFEPDLGTTIVLGLTAGSMFFIAGANVVHAFVGSAALCLLLVEFVINNTAYRADRIKAYLDPWADPTGVGWHTTQTLIALGSGGLAGLGLGASRQKYFWIPNAHTDTIFAIVGEEIGFVGTTLVLAVFLVFVWRGLTIACAAVDPLGRALATGCTLLIGWQAILNMAVVCNLVPNTGIPLPFLSYGGSSAIVCLAAVGILLNVSRTVDPKQRSWRAWLSGNVEPQIVAPEPLPNGDPRLPRLPAPAAAIVQTEPVQPLPRQRPRRPRKLTPTRR